MGVTVAMGVIKLGCAVRGRLGAARGAARRAARLHRGRRDPAHRLPARRCASSAIRWSAWSRSIVLLAASAGRRADAVGSARRARRGAGGDASSSGAAGRSTPPSGAGAASGGHARRARLRAPAAPTLAWLDAVDATLPYLPLAVPFALATVVGGIDNTESAIVAGDEYRTRDILLTEAVADHRGSAAAAA